MMNEGFSYRYFAVPCWAAFTGLLVAALLLASCGDDGKTPTPMPAATVDVTVESGGMALNTSVAATDAPAQAPAGMATEMPAELAAQMPASPTPEAEKSVLASPVAQEVLVPDTPVVAYGVLRLYADVDPNGQRLAQYEAGAEFIVVEPGDYETYPVDMNGVRWYRVRAQDGLVGWVMADAVGEKN
jgi:hypothetical protein